MREKSARIDVNGVSAGRLHDGHAFGGDVIAEIRRGNNAVLQVVLVEPFIQAHGYGFQVATGEAAVGGKTFRQNQEIFLRLGQDVVVGAEEAADIYDRVLLGGHRAAVRVREHLLRDFARRLVRVAWLAQLDEVGVLGEAAGVDVERNLVVQTDFFHRFDVCHRDGLTAAGVVGDGEHHKGNAVCADTVRSLP